MGAAPNLIARFLDAVRREGVGSALLRAWYFIKRRSRRYSPGTTAPWGKSSIPTDHICISVLMPVFNTPRDVLDEAVASVRSQSYSNWELCICDDCSTREETRSYLAQLKGIDPRIKVFRSDRNLHIASATNAAAEFATGQFVAFLDHDDKLEPYALEWVVRSISAAPEEVDLLYSDEDKIEPDGSYSEPYFKPGWSPEHLCSVMYVLHFLVVRKSLFLDLGGLRDEFTGAQDYDLTLRASAVARRICHIPQVLYHWRKLPGSAAAQVDAKPQALLNARRALQAHVSSVSPDAKVTDGQLPGTFRVHWPIDNNEAVTLLITTNAKTADIEGRGNILLVSNFIRSVVEKTTFKNYRVLVVDNHNLPEDARAEIKRSGGETVSYSYSGKFNYAKKLNFAFDLVKTENVVVLNDDLEVITADWLEALLAFSTRQEIGAVGARLLYPNGRIQHAGMALTPDGSCVHLFHNLPREQVGYYGYTHIIRNYSAVTGAVLATRMSLVRKLGGFRERLATDYNDVDFCLRLQSLGYRIVYTPYAELYHFEGATLKRSATDPREQGYFSSQWHERMENDPYFSIAARKWLS